MNKLMIVGCATMAAFCGFAEEQKVAPTPAEIVKQEAVQELLLEEDGVAFVTGADGNPVIYTRGTATYKFSEAQEILDARKVARMRAQKNLSSYLETKVSGEDGLDYVAKKSCTLSSDGVVQREGNSKEALETLTSTLKTSTKSIIHGLITLSSVKVPDEGKVSGQIQVTMVYSPKTAKVALATAKAFQDHQAELKINEAKNEGRVNAARATAQSAGQGACQTAVGVADAANASGTASGGCPASAVTPVNKSEIRVNKTEY